MRTTCLTCAVLLLATGAAGAETLYNQDGVQLSATARVIDPGGATCRVREERHSAEEYEKLKPNHSQPLNVWRVELVVANYSTCWMEIENYPRCYFWNDQWKLTKTTATTRPARTGKPVPLLLSPEVLPHRPPAGLLCLGVADHHAGVLPAAGERLAGQGPSRIVEALRPGAAR